MKKEIRCSRIIEETPKQASVSHKQQANKFDEDLSRVAPKAQASAGLFDDQDSANLVKFLMLVGGILVFFFCVSLCSSGSSGGTTYKSREERLRDKKKKEEEEFNRAMWEAARKIDGYE